MYNVTHASADATKILVGIILLTGFTILGAAGVEELHGQVITSGQGAVTETLPLMRSAELRPAPLHAAAPQMQPSAVPAGLQLVGGMLLILLGFLLHALVIRTRHADRSIPVHQAPRKPRQERMEIFWVDQVIEL